MTLDHLVLEKMKAMLETAKISGKGKDYIRLGEHAGLMIAQIEHLEKENSILRSIATKIMPCHYCGVAEIAKCPHGFPGCALADDMFVAEETVYMELRELKQKYKALMDEQERIEGLARLARQSGGQD